MPYRLISVALSKLPLVVSILRQAVALGRSGACFQAPSAGPATRPAELHRQIAAPGPRSSESCRVVANRSFRATRIRALLKPETPGPVPREKREPSLEAAPASGPWIASPRYAPVGFRKAARTRNSRP